MLRPVTDTYFNTASYNEFADGYFHPRKMMRGFLDNAALDVLRDEGEAFGRHRDKAGVPVTVTRYDGLLHDDGPLNAPKNLR